MEYSRKGHIACIFLTLLFAVICSSMQCTTPGNDLRKDQKFYAAIPQENFAQDTLLILKYHQWARSYLFMDAEKSMFYAKYVLRLSQKHQWAKGKILAYNLLSTYYLLDGSYDILRELSNETIFLSQELDLPFYAAHAQRFLAESYAEYRQWDSAMVCYSRAIDTFKTIGSDSSVAICLENLGNSYREKRMYNESLDKYDEAYAVFDRIGSDWGRATILQSKGYLHVVRKEMERGKKYFDDSFQLFTKIENRYGQLNVLNDMANNYCLTGEYDKGITYANAALDTSVLFHSVQQTNWALLSLSRAYKGKKRYDKALDYMEKVIFNRRMVHTDNVQRQYTMFQLSYENQLKDSEIQEKDLKEQIIINWILIGFSCLIIAFATFLWMNNEKLRKKNAEIRVAMTQGQSIERKRVAAELHDNLGGTLASLNWYLHGIDKKSLPSGDQRTYENIHQMVGAAYRELRNLSHNLMPPELEEHGLVIAMERLVNKLNENKDIDFRLASRLHHRMERKIEFELYSIILELTNNVIKHSGSTQALISLDENQRNVLLVVSDNGAGMLEQSKHGIGLKNIKNRVESLRGKINIVNESQSGTRVEIEIPKHIA